MNSMDAQDHREGNSPSPQQPASSVSESRRLLQLRQLCLLDTQPDEAFDRVTRLAARVLHVPIALISLVDESRVWFKSRVGLDVAQFPRDITLCARVIAERRALVVPDATRDPRYAANPLVTGAPQLRAYLGVPLYSKGREPVGTLCAIDLQAREFDADEIDLWNDFAGLVQDMLYAHELAVESEQQLRAAAASAEKHTQMERRLQRIANHIPAMIGYWNTELRCQFANEAYRAYSGLDPEQMIGLHFRELLGEEIYARNSPYAHAALAGKQQKFQRSAFNAAGKLQHTEGQYLPDYDETGAVCGFFVLVTDITELTAAKGDLEAINARLLKESTTDFLTGLANRRVFTERSEAAFRRFQQTGDPYSLVVMDLDNFKLVNDGFGHEIGDRVLGEMGKILGGGLRGRDDLPARLGGEEFAVLCPGDFTESSLQEMAARIQSQINSTTVESPAGPVSFSASFGIASVSAADSSWTNAFARADSALYKAKETGKNRIVFGGSSAKGTTGRFRSMGIPPLK
jgi:diguanylate cyclase (GGDEF)-like protein/PAS domain S-box-containing protein